MRHGSLFSGIGGFDLASQWMGWENIFQVEIDDYCQKVLKKNFPNVKRYGDIKEFKGERGSVDILTGGFPCQPFSTAGKRKGESDDRYLWPEYLRIIREIQPAYVVGENVAGLISMEDGKTLDGIFTDLESEGYQVESFIIPACGVGAWHRRDRIWIIAYNKSAGGWDKIGEHDRQGRQRAQGIQSEMVRQEGDSSDDTTITSGKITSIRDKLHSPRTNTNSPGSHRAEVNKHRETKLRHEQERKPGQMGEDVSNTDNTRTYTKEINTTETGIDAQRGFKRCDNWSTEPNVGRVANGIPKRVDRLKGLGNAIVPQVAQVIFEAINANP